ncbi:MAG: hypothetical protein LBB90_00655 [Tannerella sp.]|jgi:hypothetical protein|nr:hypothetical protein [Tannerella sp.]
MSQNHAVCSIKTLFHSYQTEASFLGKKFTVNYGRLPTLLRPLFALGGVDGIIGFDFFDNFEVLLDIVSKRLLYR